MFHRARVLQIANETPTVKRILFGVGETFSYLSGQWVDVKVSGLDHVGGFSFTSSPTSLPSTSTVELAVKRSNDVIARFLHEKASVGTECALRAGGSCTFTSKDVVVGRKLLLIAGGIGITPLISIARYVEDLHCGVETVLIHSVRQESELAFRSQLEKMQAMPDSCLQYIPVITNGNSSRRIDSNMLQEIVPEKDGSKILSYVCGPSKMIDAMEKLLTDRNIDVRSEKWW